MKKTKINDIFAKGGCIRDDGRMVHDMYLMQVKTPEQVDRAVGLLQRRRDVQGRAGRGRPRPRSKCALVEVSDAGGAAAGADRATQDADGNLRHPAAGLPRPAAARPGQRLVLRDAEPGPGGDLRPAQHRQLRARRALHDRRLRGLDRRSSKFGINYWVALVLAPLVVGALGVVDRAHAAASGCTSSTRSTACC